MRVHMQGTIQDTQLQQWHLVMLQRQGMVQRRHHCRAPGYRHSQQVGWWAASRMEQEVAMQGDQVWQHQVAVQAQLKQQQQQGIKGVSLVREQVQGLWQEGGCRVRHLLLMHSRQSLRGSSRRSLPACR
jgi:hypothetical protein